VKLIVDFKVLWGTRFSSQNQLDKGETQNIKLAAQVHINNSINTRNLKFMGVVNNKKLRARQDSTFIKSLKLSVMISLQNYAISTRKATHFERYAKHQHSRIYMSSQIKSRYFTP
jgi:hypothetical protein